MDDPINITPEPKKRVRTRPSIRMSEADQENLRAVLMRPEARKDGKIQIGIVGKLTGLTAQAIYGFLRRDPYLKAELAGTDSDKLVPGEADTIDTTDQPTLPMALVNFSSEQIKEVEAIRKQNIKMAARDWEAAGLTADQGQQWEKYAKLGATPMLEVLKGVGGQLISNLTLLDEILKGDAEKILQKNLPAEYDKRGERRDPDEVERDWRYMVYAGMNLQLQMFSHLHKTQALLARVFLDAQKLKDGKQAVEKGNFESRSGKKSA